ncbi:hypothetical protein Tco_0887847, partial [Tanacetum coccineum]
TAENVQPDRNPKAQNRPFDAACQRANAENVHADRRTNAQSSPFNAACQIGATSRPLSHMEQQTRASHFPRGRQRFARYQLKCSPSNAKISPFTRKGSADFAVDNILDKPDKPALGQTTSSGEKKVSGLWRQPARSIPAVRTKEK